MSPATDTLLRQGPGERALPAMPLPQTVPAARPKGRRAGELRPAPSFSPGKHNRRGRRSGERSARCSQTEQTLHLERRPAGVPSAPAAVEGAPQQGGDPPRPGRGESRQGARRRRGAPRGGPSSGVPRREEASPLLASPPPLPPPALSG